MLPARVRLLVNRLDPHHLHQPPHPLAVHLIAFKETFDRLARKAGIASTAQRRPRLHDLRHTFAVRALADSPSSRSRSGAHMVALATYMGHVYEEVFLRAYDFVAEARAGIGAWLTFYNNERKHQSHGYRTPAEIFAAAQACGHVDNGRTLTTSPQEQQQQKEKDSASDEQLIVYQHAQVAK